jgi:hypothetical protein
MRKSVTILVVRIPGSLFPKLVSLRTGPVTGARWRTRPRARRKVDGAAAFNNGVVLRIGQPLMRRFFLAAANERLHAVLVG